ncbi:MAG: hypothetical protein ABIJ14_00225 [Nanoarchaeota archaeon]|nr:hypothetical protein [Nanoarchaeota archaeon]
MKFKKWELPIQIILFLIVIVLGASVIWDVLYLIFKDRININLMRIIHVILIFILIEILLRKTEPGKYIDNKLFKRKSN